ncbi:membrane hypothetical protein [Magnetospirillum sp. LM-5]|uniref:hypothetical protein n=1 Tax=Magnetospirillum sp. LM-5 TaxID=2681466 RepID=UPI0013835CCD|nr:hypothetical protein [Magnetospirillum sp. LM-5]CAA7619079.1 membrane hypothetical protein [Magnetospirillum sp. LM-5]
MSTMSDRMTSFLAHDVQFGRFSLSAVTVVVVAVALVTNLIGLIGGPIMYQPDSGNYLIAAAMLWQQGTLMGVDLNRVPGYAIFLSPILGLGGAGAMTLMATVQHGLAVATSAMIVRIGHLLDERRILGLVAGLLSAFSLQFQSYSRLPMSEIPHAFMAILGLLLVLQHLRGGRRGAILVAIAAFCLATVIRPSTQLIPWFLLGYILVRMAFPGSFARLFPNWPVPSRRSDAVTFGAGTALTVLLLAPWAVHNWSHQGYFGLTGSFGINFYSNTVEYGGFADEQSPALAEIKRHWEEFEAKTVAAGQPPEDVYTWRHHWASARHVMGNTGWPMWEADKLFKQAAFDAIKAHPGQYLRHIAQNIYNTLMMLEPTYNYVPGLRKGEIPPAYMEAAWSLDDMERVRAFHDRAVLSMGLIEPGTLKFGQANPVTPVYGALLTAYQSVVMYGNRLLLLLAAGGAIAVVLVVRGRREWLVILAFLTYVVGVTAVVVPGAPRHRLPIDPVICLVYALALVTAIRLGWHRLVWVWREKVLPRPQWGLRETGRAWFTLAVLGAAVVFGLKVGGKGGLLMILLAIAAILV